MRKNLPPGYYRELPKLALRELAGTARVYALAIELIRHSDSRLDRPKLVRFLNSFQVVAPLTIGELWAWPSMLRLALIENLRRLAALTLESRDARHAADVYVARIDASGDGGRAACCRDGFTAPSSCSSCGVCASTGRGSRRCARRVEDHLAAEGRSAEDAIRAEHQRQATAQVSVANVITSLRLCSTLDWSEYFEAVSLVERVLQQDPAGVYTRMDLLSRDRYRQAVEELAEPTARRRCGSRAARWRAPARRSSRGPRRIARPTSATT